MTGLIAEHHAKGLGRWQLNAPPMAMLSPLNTRFIKWKAIKIIFIQVRRIILRTYLSTVRAYDIIAWIHQKTIS